MDKQMLAHINWSLLLMMLALFITGIVNLYSASASLLEGGIQLNNFYQKQLIWGGVGMLTMLGVMLFDYRHLKNVTIFLYAAAIILLILVLLVGSIYSGARRWLDLGILSFQPSEAAKISVLLMGALVLSRSKDPLGPVGLLGAIAIGVVPAFLIVMQPDLGTSLNILMILGGLILFRGIKLWLCALIGGTCTLSAVGYFFLYKLGTLPSWWSMLHPYQQRRIMTFLNPENDPQGAGYHIRQALIAIGSGETWGKGFLEGPQSKLLYLPERHTDFAIAVFGEEWGFVGCVFLMALFCLFLLSIFTTARDAKDRFGTYIAVGVFFYFFWQIFINIGMVVGLLPVVGMPLPFISYGGSSTLVNFCLVGLVLNVSMRRFVFKTK
ncbi:MAG: rod shape-determining protein RodA [Desulfovibrionaceae bacterium]|nr:rod shape-determining protein RodA [Desulfovibrionaceae bacterium]